MADLSRYINLNWQDRFVNEDLLRSSYLRYEESRNPQAKPYISFDWQDLELGIVTSQEPEIAKAVSSILTRSLEDAKNSKGGYLPSDVVENVQYNIISPYGIANLWGTTGHRFVLSTSAGPGMREIIASILVGRSKDTIFFLTGMYNNLRHSEVATTVDLNLPDKNHPDKKWFDRFAFPQLDKFKPSMYHHIANFVVTQRYRRQGVARFMLDAIVKNYSRDYIDKHNRQVNHSQHLLCGRGFWQIGDPPWFARMKALGFYLRGGAESFFIEHEWAPLPTIAQDGKTISNIEYNQSFDLPRLYQEFEADPRTDQHLLGRIPEVMRLSQNPKAKLQYFQVMYNFL